MKKEENLKKKFWKVAFVLETVFGACMHACVRAKSSNYLGMISGVTSSKY